MIDIKLTEKASLVLAMVAGGIVASCAVSYLRNEPLVVAGKEFGFGGGELQKRTAEFEAYKSETERAKAAWRGLLQQASATIRRQNEDNEALVAEEQKRFQQSNGAWFPIDDVNFYGNDKFSTESGRAGRGKWSDRDSELILKLIAYNDSEAVLETNLFAPWNKIRIQEGQSLQVLMKTYDYRISVKLIMDDHAEVRVERRARI